MLIFFIPIHSETQGRKTAKRKDFFVFEIDYFYLQDSKN